MNITIDCYNKNSEEVREIIAKKLMFPDYYGDNWSAFLDCMRDLDWISDSSIEIQIANYSPDNNDMLLFTLSYCVFWWQNELSQQQPELLDKKTLRVTLL